MSSAIPEISGIASEKHQNSEENSEQTKFGMTVLIIFSIRVYQRNQPREKIGINREKIYAKYVAIEIISAKTPAAVTSAPAPGPRITNGRSL